MSLFFISPSWILSGHTSHVQATHFMFRWTKYLWYKTEWPVGYTFNRSFYFGTFLNVGNLFSVTWIFMVSLPTWCPSPFPNKECFFSLVVAWDPTQLHTEVLFSPTSEAGAGAFHQVLLLPAPGGGTWYDLRTHCPQDSKAREGPNKDEIMRHIVGGFRPLRCWHTNQIGPAVFCCWPQHFLALNLSLSQPLAYL